MLFAVAFVDSMTGFAVGGGNWGEALKTIDGGTTWQEMPVLRDGISHIPGATFSTGTNAFAVGYLETALDDGHPRIARTFDAGETWEFYHSSEWDWWTAAYDVAFANPLDGVIAFSQGQVLTTSDGGDTWTQRPTGFNTVESVCLDNSGSGTAVGYNGLVIRTTDAGVSWTPQTSGVTRHLHDVHFVDPFIGIAVGEYGTILQTTDGGENWTFQTVRFNYYSDIRGVFIVDTQTRVAVGDEGVIMRSTDGGDTWSKSNVAVPTLIHAFFAETNAQYVNLMWDVVSDDVILGFQLMRMCDDDKYPVILPASNLIEKSERAFRDEGVEPGREYVYRLSVVIEGGDKIQSAPLRVTVPATKFTLSQSHPNPFVLTTRMEFSLGMDGPVTLAIYDTSGRLVATLLNEFTKRGTYAKEWDGYDHSGKRVASGVYFFRLTAGKHRITRRAVLLK